MFFSMSTDKTMEPTRPSTRMGKPRRSKGCTTCIQRKVKCDEKVPSCGQCLKGDRKCSGIASAIFVNMSSTTLATTSTFAPRDTIMSTAKKPMLEPKAPEKKTLSISTSSQDVAELERSKSPEEWKPPIEIITSTEMSDKAVRKKRKLTHTPKFASPEHKYQRTGTLPPVIDNIQVTSHQFLCHFINFFARASTKDVFFNSWMSTLPPILASSTLPLSTCTYQSISAASMIYYGRRTNDRAIVLEAYRCYGAGLSLQRKVLEDIVRKRRTPSAEELCTPLLMSFFEISCCTSRTAYFQHLFGAGKLLEAWGPERCQEGILFELFYTLRLQLNHASIATRLRSPFCTVRWLTIPFALCPKKIIDHLVDIITITTDLHSRCNLLHALPPLATSYREMKRRITTQALGLKKRLDEYWVQDIRERAGVRGWVGDCYEGKRGFDGPPPVSPQTSETGREQVSVTPPLPSPTNSLPDAPTHDFYSTARLLVLAVLISVNAAPDLYDEQMEAHSASLLSTAEVMTSLEVGYACLRLVLPLHVIGVWGGTTEQHARARAILKRWQEKGWMVGICDVVLGCLGISSSRLPCASSVATWASQMEEDTIAGEIWMGEPDDF